METKSKITDSIVEEICSIDIENIPIPAVFHNHIGIILDSNKAFGNNFKHLIAQSLNDIIPGFLTTFKSESNQNSNFINIENQKGIKKIYKLTSKNISKNLFISLFDDITELNINTLTNTKKLNTKFATVISHDLKNPLTAIHGFADLLTNKYNEYDNVTKLHFLKIILESSSQCIELTNNLLYWTKNDSKDIKPRIKQTDIADLIDDCINFVLPTSQTKNINISFSIEDARFVNCDKDITGAIIRNLLTNAIKFTPRDGKIKVDVRYRDNQLKISVIDNGIGIANKKILELHSNNIQESELGTEQEIGSGIGLMIVKDFIKLQKGTFGIESKVNKGTTFWFTIPV